jgi:hypothetical protein
MESGWGMGWCVPGRWAATRWLSRGGVATLQRLGTQPRSEGKCGEGLGDGIGQLERSAPIQPPKVIRV